MLPFRLLKVEKRVFRGVQVFGSLGSRMHAFEARAVHIHKLDLGGLQLQRLQTLRFKVN